MEDAEYIRRLERAGRRWKRERDAAERQAAEWQDVAERIADDSARVIANLRARLAGSW